MSLKYKHLLTACFLIFVSCGNLNKEQTDAENNFVHLKPDSVLSADEIKLKQRLGKIINDNFIVENNEFVFKLTQREFKKTGIPMKYYDLILKNIKENNKYINDHNIDNADALLKHGKKEYENNSDIF